MGGDWLWLKKGYFSGGKVRDCKSDLTVNRTWGLQMTGDVIFSLTLSQLSYQIFCVLSCAYAREPPCNNFDSTSSDQLSFLWRSSQLIFLKFYWQYTIIWVNVHSTWSHFYFQPFHISYILYTTSAYIYTLTRKAPCLCHTIPHRCAPLDDRFTCVARDIFSVHSPCSSFAIFVTVGGW